MKSTKIWANFSVKDVKRTDEFYTQLGFTPNKPNNHPKLASFLFGDSNFVIHFFEQGSQIDEYLPPSNEAKASEIIFTLSAETQEEVKDWLNKVRKSGGTVVHELSEDQTSHYGFSFTDPDGHKFNVLLM